MLYITTRSNTDTYTAYRALCANSAPDGGHFVPFKLPRISELKLRSYTEGSFNQTVAEILNLFFGTDLTTWDMEISFGKNPPDFLNMNHRIVVSKLWHNADGSFDHVVERLYNQLCGVREAPAVAGNWANTAIRIAFLFGIYGQLVRTGLLEDSETIDIVASAEELLMPMAAYYAHQMGLPIKMIICACDDSCNIWDLIHHGTVSPAAHTPTMSLGIERLLQATLGRDAVHDFMACRTTGKSFVIIEDNLEKIPNEFFCAVAGAGRADATVNSIYRSSGYIVDPKTALCFSALQDYRATTALSRRTLICAEESPSRYVSRISSVTGLSEGQVKNLVNN